MYYSPLVSVIIPCYNCRDFIAQALESVMRQTYKNIEIIVVDDGSSDGTKEFITNNYSDIIYFYQRNQGPAAARNRGIKLSKGKYIAFLDADDAWLPNKIESQIEIMSKKDDVSLIHTGRITISEKKKKVLKRNIVSGDIFNFLLKQDFITTSSVMVTRDCISDVGMFDENPNLIGVEDYLLWLKVAHRHKCFYIDRPLVEYYIHDQNISLDYKKRINNLLKLKNTFCRTFYQEPRRSKNIFLSGNSISISLIYFKRMNFPMAFFYFFESITKNPFITLQRLLDIIKLKMS